jgi:hypothetical protein
MKAEYLIVNQGPTMVIYEKNGLKSTPEQPQQPLIKNCEFSAPQGHRVCESSTSLVKRISRNKTILITFWGYYVSLYTVSSNPGSSQVSIKHKDTVVLTKQIVIASKFEKTFFCVDSKGNIFKYYFKKHMLLPPKKQEIKQNQAIRSGTMMISSSKSASFLNNLTKGESFGSSASTTADD